MARFDIFVNPNPVARHALYADVQSDLVDLSTRWCIPLYRYLPARPLIVGPQAVMQIGSQQYVMDAPNLLAVPLSLLRKKAGRMVSKDQSLAESCIEFMLRGY